MLGMLGPTLRAEVGDTIRVTFRNLLKEHNGAGGNGAATGAATGAASGTPPSRRLAARATSAGRLDGQLPLAAGRVPLVLLARARRLPLQSRCTRTAWPTSRTPRAALTTTGARVGGPAGGPS